MDPAPLGLQPEALRPADVFRSESKALDPVTSVEMLTKIKRFWCVILVAIQGLRFFNRWFVFVEIVSFIKTNEVFIYCPRTRISVV